MRFTIFARASLYASPPGRSLRRRAKQPNHRQTTIKFPESFRLGRRPKGACPRWQQRQASGGTLGRAWRCLLQPAALAEGGDVDSIVEAERETLVARAVSLAATAAGDTEKSGIRRFVAELYAHVPPADVAARSPADLAGAAVALWRFAAARRPGEAKVRVYNPRPESAPGGDGWSSPRTIIEIVNDDMPFLVDSVTAAINGADRSVHLVIHPIVTVARDLEGRLVEFDPPTGTLALRESWMQIEITPEHASDCRDELAAALRRVLSDVRAAVTDWQPMRAALLSVVLDLSHRPPPLPAEDVAEVQEFLRWLDGNNFTLLGFRDYPFSAGAEAPPPALGILRDENYPV